MNPLMPVSLPLPHIAEDVALLGNRGAQYVFDDHFALLAHETREKFSDLQRRMRRVFADIRIEVLGPKSPNEAIGLEYKHPEGTFGARGIQVWGRSRSNYPILLRVWYDNDGYAFVVDADYL